MLSNYNFIDVEERLTELKDGKVYVCNNEGVCELKCPCGCGDTIVLNLLRGARPCWSLVGLNTINPSIDRTVGCKSHFSIVAGRVINHSPNIQKRI